MPVQLFPNQLAAIEKLSNGKVLWGGVGTGKSITALAYYYTKVIGGAIRFDGSLAAPKKNIKLYIITTASKRDKHEWVHECTRFLIDNVVIDSWNNLHNFTNIKDAFFIFDEHRLSGYGAWAKAFITIAQQNQWVLLTATPGDVWMDYCTLFVANHFFKNKTEFCREHVVWKSYISYPVIDFYVNLHRLEELRNRLLVKMEPHRVIQKQWSDITTLYDKDAMDQVVNGRWDALLMRPLRDAAAVCRAARRLVNLHDSRRDALDQLLDKHPRIVLFYNFDYELSMLLHHFERKEVDVAQWNGHKHEPIPPGTHWIYLVQYAAGAEGWECTNADTTVFFSLPYSWKTLTQAAGRIDRTNTSYQTLFYYRFVSDSLIEKSIVRALEKKRLFNEMNFFNQPTDSIN